MGEGKKVSKISKNWNKIKETYALNKYKVKAIENINWSFIWNTPYHLECIGVVILSVFNQAL